MTIFKINKTNLVLGMLLFMSASGTVFAQQRTVAKKGASSQEIVFTNSTWKEVAAEAKKSGKYIFADAYTSWCGPCKLLKSTTFKDKKAAAYFNENFINYSADMEKGEGIGLADHWDITAYPTLLFMNSDGKIILRQVGYIDGAKLLDAGRQAMAKR